MNGESVAISSSGEFRDVVLEAFSFSGAVLASPPNTGWMLRRMTVAIAQSRPVLLLPLLALTK
jgi:hypothetical protein